MIPPVQPIERVYRMGYSHCVMCGKSLIKNAQSNLCDRCTEERMNSLYPKEDNVQIRSRRKH